MIESLSSELIAHLWQSTLVIGVVWLIARESSGRGWLWKAASVSRPFSWLVSRCTVRVCGPVNRTAPVTFFMEEILAPPVWLRRSPTARPTAVWPGAGVSLSWLSCCSGGGVSGSCRQRRRQVRVSPPTTRRPQYVVAVDVSLSRRIRVRSYCCPTASRTIDVGMAIVLMSATTSAVTANARAVHMLIEALFWFHPLVWWMEGRLIDERERACDQAVLRAGTDPAGYAEGILTVCRFTLRAPLACVAGVTGADLRTRVESIVRKELGAPMTLGRRVAVALVVGGLLGVPIVSGILRLGTPLLAVGQEPRTPAVFEVAAVTEQTGQIRPDRRAAWWSISVTNAKCSRDPGCGFR